jgi:hypothetical protein
VLEISAAERLRLDDAVRCSVHNAIEIGVGEAAVECVDPHVKARARLAGAICAQEIARHLAGCGLITGSDGIFEI